MNIAEKSVAEKKPRYEEELILTPHPEWAQDFWDRLVPIKDRVVQHPIFQTMGEGELPIDHFRYTLLNFYPLVENFPKYMALNLAKCRRDKPGHDETRNWIMGNMRVEQRHAYWYQDWAEGFGVDRDMLNTVTPPAAMDAVNHYLWDQCRNAPLVEGIGAANLAIEWATGEWTRYVVKGMRAYAKRGEAEVDRRTMAWLRAHSHYDDAHPHEAMELIKLLAHTDEERQRAFEATRRGLEYYWLALEDCWRPLDGSEPLLSR
jgi:pyrroloquinoline quinone (PQQ) biosynthesis protein C